MFRMQPNVAVEPAVEPATGISTAPEPPAVTHPAEVVAVSQPVQAPPGEPRVLGPEFVRALGAPLAAKPAPLAAKPALPAASRAPVSGTAAPEPAPNLEPAVAKPSVRRALVVDDSLVARMELGRVLERRGWEVEWVETAAEMWSMLPANDWSIVFVDVSLPDARGRAHLKTLAAQQRVARHRFELVALTRDEADERLVLDAGIVRMLRKPFASGAVERMVRELQAAGA
jgi:CheY-like chemotaxis protein